MASERPSWFFGLLLRKLGVSLGMDRLAKIAFVTFAVFIAWENTRRRMQSFKVHDNAISWIYFPCLISAVAVSQSMPAFVSVLSFVFAAIAAFRTHGVYPQNGLAIPMLASIYMTLVFYGMDRLVYPIQPVLVAMAFGGIVPNVGMIRFVGREAVTCATER